MHLKLLQKRPIKTKAEATGGLISNKFAGKITKVSKSSPKNSSEANKEEILKEKFIPPDLKHKITDDLRLKGENY